MNLDQQQREAETRRVGHLLGASPEAIDRAVGVREQMHLLDKAREILRGTGADRADRETVRDLWRLLLPDECGRDGTEESERG